MNQRLWGRGRLPGHSGAATAPSNEDAYRRALGASLALLARRSRSSSELQTYLVRRGVSPAIRQDVLARLIELQLVDDAAFALSWVQNRQEYRPSGERLLRLELRQKGIADDLVTTALAQNAQHSDPIDLAYFAAQGRVRSLARLMPLDAQKRLHQFLLRRGFTHQVAWSAVRRLLDENSAERPSGDLAQ